MDGGGRGKAGELSVGRREAGKEEHLLGELEAAEAETEKGKERGKELALLFILLLFICDFTV